MESIKWSSMHADRLGVRKRRQTSPRSLCVRESLPLLPCPISSAITQLRFLSEVFTKALLCHKAPLDLATQFARKAMLEDRDRVSMFGVLIQVGDSIVSIIYLKGTPSSSPNIVSSGVPNHRFSPIAPYGRKNEIMRLESILLTTCQPVLLSGPAGIGKSYGSYLLAHLRQ